MISKASSTVVGALACQKDSFLRAFETSVISCTEHQGHVTSKDKQSKNKKSKSEEPKKVQYAVELEDTILFPEGGGQPYDVGTLEVDGTKIPVEEVIRNKLTAIHLTSEPVNPGATVKLSLDWQRRFDHMQQHTGQHLLSAVFDTYDLETLSWSMGETVNYIELPKKVSNEIVAEVNEKVNEAITQAIPIEVVTPDEHGNEVDTSHIPEDYDLSKGIIRIVKIGDLDANPCCGTHLSNTSQIQTMSLLHQVNVRGGNSRLHFICGSRAYKYLNKSHELLKNVGGNLLSCQIDEIYSKVEALNANYKKATSATSSLLKELASIEAKRIFEEFKAGKDFDFVYRADNTPEYLTLFQKELTTLINANKDVGVDLDKSQTVALFNGDYPSGTGGSVKVMGPKATEIQAELKQLLANMKGGGKGASFQAKVTKYEKNEIEKVTDYFQQLKV